MCPSLFPLLSLSAFRVQYGIAAVNSIFACTAPERAPIARSRMAVHEKWLSRTVIITRVMIRIYVPIRRNGCTLIVPARSTRITSCLFHVLFTRALSLFATFFLPSTSRYFFLSPRAIPTSRLQSSGGYFSFRAIPVSPALHPSPDALKSITYPGFYPPDRVRSITYS